MNLFPYFLQYPTRIVCKSSDANELRLAFGGWIAKNATGIIYWYSMQWTPSEIMDDQKGDCEIY